MSENTIQVETFADRAVLMAESVTRGDEMRLSIEDVATYPYKDEEQFAYVKKDDLLDALAQFGWLPEEYLKPKPLDPREAKIQEIMLHLINTDRTTYNLGDPYTTYAEAEASATGLIAYRNNAVALLDSGLVTVDE